MLRGEAPEEPASSGGVVAHLPGPFASLAQVGGGQRGRGAGGTEASAARAFERPGRWGRSRRPAPAWEAPIRHPQHSGGAPDCCTRAGRGHTVDWCDQLVANTLHAWAHTARSRGALIGGLPAGFRPRTPFPPPPAACPCWLPRCAGRRHGSNWRGRDPGAAQGADRHDHGRSCAGPGAQHAW